MPTVFFTNLALLGGLAALAIPILIHLLIKRRKQRLRFSTIQFFVRQEKQTSQRRKLRNYLLLAVRFLLVTLLVLAFARPFTHTAPTVTTPSKRVGIFVLDRSASMQATVQGDTAWNRAVNLARAALREFKPDDLAALVTCSASTESLSGLRPASAMAKLFDGLTPEFASGDLAEGLRAAVRLVSNREPGTAATLYIVSDLQKSSAQNLPSVAIPPDVEVKLLNGGALFVPNVALLDLRLEGQVKPQAQLALKSFSDEDYPGLGLSLVVDGKEAANTSVALKAGQATNLVLLLPAFKPGWHGAEARLLMKDALSVDNTRYHAFFVPEPLRVLCIETKPGARLHEQVSFFVTSALQPDAEPGLSVPALFTVETTDPSTLARKLAPGSGSPGYAAVLLPALRQIPEQAGEALSAYVRNGGGLLLFVGDGMSANRYNAEFSDLLPMSLESVDSRANAGWHLDTFDKSAPMFAAFRGAASANLHLPEFTQRFRAASPLAPGAAVSTLAAFDDGPPLIASRTAGAGRVVFINTSMDASWSDWPKRKSYVPWLHGVVNYLGGRTSADAMQPSRLFTAGEDAEIALGQAWNERAFLLQRTGAKDESIMTGSDGRLPMLHFGAPGAYVVRDRDGTVLQRWAVNPPARESELTAFSPQEFQKELTRAGSTPPGLLQASLLGTTTGEREWWRLLLLASLGLLFAEVFLANRTRA